MKKPGEMNREELQTYISQLQSGYNEFQSRGLKLDMSRGKPGPEQLDLMEGMLTVLSKNADCYGSDGTDARNYGVLDGIPECKQLFADILEVSPQEVLIGGNSSLNMMYDTIVRALIFGVYGGQKPWSAYERIKFLCPAPGYDRHFTICESLGIEMITVPMTPFGPDMDEVERLVRDESVKGIWCIPKYSNPDGITYSDDTVRRFAALSPAALDFRIFWDNAYAVHDFNETPDSLLSLFGELKKTGKQDMVFMFASTSKISYPGAGVGAMAASTDNLAQIKKCIFAQTIGHDKLNQLRHVRFFQNLDGVKKQMKRYSPILSQKFSVVLNALESELGGLELGSWANPNGGYFVSFNALPGCAKRIVSLLKDAGVVMTGAGATFPYGKDPQDRNIRIAPTYPSTGELKTAMELFCLCVKLASAESLLKNV